MKYACPAFSKTRGLEDLLNTAWGTIAVPGEWLAFDEQMVKSTARAMHALMRFNKAKPIKHGETVFDEFLLIINKVPSTVGI